MANLKNYDESGAGFNLTSRGSIVADLDAGHFRYSVDLGHDRATEYYEVPNTSLQFSLVADYSSSQKIIESINFYYGSSILTAALGDGYWTVDEIIAGFRVMLSGSDWIVGNKYGDVIRGFGGNDTLEGQGGNDKLVGGYGADKIYAGSGQDTLIGGLGKDTLQGGRDGHGDDFVFTSRYDSAVGADRDVVREFTKGSDDIDLRGIDARVFSSDYNNMFRWSGRTAEDFSVWWTPTEDGVVIKGDVTGDAKADFEIRLASVSSITSADVLL